MSGSSEKKIICRQCGESIPADVDNCPHCGTSVRGNTGAIIGLLLGGILFLAALADLVVNGETRILVYGLAGLVIAAIGGYVIYEKRQRINKATEAEAAERA